MPAFGQYETVRELHRGGLGSVWSARAAGAAGEPAFVIKLCEPDPTITGHDVAAQAVEQFLDQAAVQKAAGGPSWAPVHDSGLCESGAFLVTDLFPRTLERLAGSRVRLDAAGLHRIVSSIAGGLTALQKSAGRPHGNLKPSNVLVGPGEPSQARVVLTDPLPTRSVKGIRAGADARALGEIIHQLVLHQPFRGAYPIPLSAEWAALGRRRQGWIDFVNRLLDPHPEAGPPTPEQIEESLGGLAETKKRSTGLLVGVATAVILVVGGGTFLLTQTGGGGSTNGGEGSNDGNDDSGIAWEPEGLANWEALCEAFGRGRFGAFLSHLGEKPDPAGPASTRRELYRKDPALAAALTVLDEAQKGGPADPNTIAGSSVDVNTLKRQVPDQAKSGSSMARARRMVEAIHGLNAALAERWAPAEGLKGDAEIFQHRGWSVLAEKLRTVAREADAEDWRTRAGRIDRVLAAAAAVGAARDRIQSLETRASQLAESGDKVLSAFGAWINTAGASPVIAEAEPLAAIEEFQKRLAAIGQVGDRLAEALGTRWPAIDAEYFLANSASHRDLADPPSAAVFETWLLEVTGPSFARPDAKLDPTREWKAVSRLAEAREKIDRLARDFPDQVVAGRAERVAQLASEIDAVAGLEWNRRNQDRKIAEATRLSGEIERLWTEASGALDQANEGRIAGVQDARGRLADDTPATTGSAAINEVWESWRRRFEASVTEANYAQVPARAREAKDVLLRFNEAMGAPPPAADPNRSWNRALAQAAQAERERRIGAALASVKAAPPQDGGSSLRPSLEGAARDYQQWAGELTELARGFNAVEDLLNQAYGLDEPTPGGDTIGARETSLLAQPVVSAPGVRAALAPVEDRLVELRRIAGLADAGQLAASASASLGTTGARSPAAGLAAWRKLGTLAWPASLDELRQEQNLQAKLGVEVRVITDPARQGALTKELADASRARWLKGASALRETPDIEGAIGLMPAFGVEAGDLADPRLAYNLAAFELRRLVTAAPGAPAPGDDQVQARAASFANRIGALDARVRDHPRVAPVLAELTAIASGTEPPAPKVDLTRLGPGSAGWAGEVVGDGGGVRFTPPGGGTPVDFVLVEPTESMPTPVFLSAAEVSVEMAQAVLADSGARGAFLSLLPEGAAEGPSGWVRNGDRIEVNSTWLEPIAASSLGRLTEAKYAPIVQSIRGGERPAGTLPLQQVSPAAAMFLARTAGCRLPTSAEWSAARAGPGGTGGSGWNLRDQAWEARRAQVAGLEAALIADRVSNRAWLPWPDRGAFVPPDRQAAVPTKGDAAAGAGNDGHVWFTPVGADPDHKLHHLVGNVAEFVFDDAAKADAVEATPEAVRALVSGSAAAVGVIGGSALSAPTVEPDRPGRMDPFDVQDLKRYADVGLRLAFTAEGTVTRRKPFAQRIAEALTANPYLAPG